MQREFNVEATVGKPQVAYRETITKKVDRSSTATSSSRAAPASSPWSRSPSSPTRAAATSSSTRSRRQDPARVHQPDQPGHPDARSTPACSPATRRSTSRSTLVDGQYHDVDSSRDGVQDRRPDGFTQGRREAKPVLLEPIMAVEVVTPEDYMGDVMGDLVSRRGRIGGMEARATRRSSGPRCRCRRCSATATDLRSRTQGRATYTMQFDAVPAGARRRSPPRSSSGCAASDRRHPRSHQSQHQHLHQHRTSRRARHG